MDVKGLVRDKRVVGVVGVGAALGAFVLLRGKGGAAGSSSTGAGTTLGGGAGTSLGTTADTTASDIASTLSSFSADQQATMTDFAAQITDQLGLLSTRAPATPATTPRSTAGTVGTKLNGTTVGSSTAARTLAPGYGWFATGSQKVTLSQIAKTYGTTVAGLQTMNPKLKGLSATSVAPKNTAVKVRSNAGAWDLAAYRKITKK